MLGIGKIEELLVVFVIVGILAFVITMLIYVINNQRLGSIAKLIWVFAIIFIYPFAAMYYFYWADLYKRNHNKVSK